MAPQRGCRAGDPAYPPDRLRQGYGGPPKRLRRRKLHAKAEGGRHVRLMCAIFTRSKAGRHVLSKAGCHVLSRGQVRLEAVTTHDCSVESPFSGTARLARASLPVLLREAPRDDRRMPRWE